jgi:hypothetical protein
MPDMNKENVLPLSMKDMLICEESYLDGLCENSNSVAWMGVKTIIFRKMSLSALRVTRLHYFDGLTILSQDLCVSRA